MDVINDQFEENILYSDGEENEIGILDNDALESDPPSKKGRVSRTRPFTNPVHSWFVDDNGNSKCIIVGCGKVLTGKHGTNLINHLKLHKAEYRKYEDALSKMKKSADEGLQKKSTPLQPQPPTSYSLLDCFRRAAEQKDGWKKGSEKYNTAIRSIAIAFMTNGLPYRLIEDFWMQQMFITLSDGRSTNFPSRTELASIASKEAEDLKSHVQDSLTNAKQISLTLDLWTRPGYSSSLMGVTGHYVDRSAQVIRPVLLACRPIEQPHTGERIYDLYDTIRREWQLDDSKILRIVTDNGANVVKAFKDSLLLLAEGKVSGMEERFVAADLDEVAIGVHAIDTNLDESFVEDGTEDDETAEFEACEADINFIFLRKQRISCFAHNLMLVVRKAVDHSDKVKDAKGKAESLIIAITKSTKAIQLLRRSQGECGVGLIKPVWTRWIYWYPVLDRLLRLKRHVCDMCDQLSIIHDLNPVDWKIIEKIGDLLQPFVEAVTRLEGETYATVSEVYPILFGLKVKLQKFRAAYRSISNVVDKLSSELECRFASICNITDDCFDPI